MDDRTGRILTAGAVLLFASWAVILVSIWKEFGLFNWIGVDYALFSVGARLLTTGHVEAAYDLATVELLLEPFHAYYRPGMGPLRVCPIAHLPVTFMLYAPFSALSPAWGYGLWVVVNALLAFIVVRDLGQRFPRQTSGAVTALALGFLPLVYALFVGQPVVLLLWAFHRAYRGWERGRDFQAGLWCGVLVLKVQYLPFLVLVLAYKRRWSALAGLFLLSSLLLLASLDLFGPRGLAAYLETLHEASGFRAVHAMICPQQMINWRAVLVNSLPIGVSEAQGKALTLLMATLTATTLLVIWRGPWAPADPRFPLKVLGLLLVTMLATYHNHLHGATLLLVPGMILVARGGGSAALQLLLRVGFVVPTVFFTLFHNTEKSAMLLLGIMAAMLTVVVATLWPQKTRRSSHSRWVDSDLVAQPHGAWSAVQRPAERVFHES